MDEQRETTIAVEPRDGARGTGSPAAERRGGERADGARDQPPPGMGVRDEDLEPHGGLRYIARLFKVLSLLLILLLTAEIVIGIFRQGAAGIPSLLVDATRLIVFAGLLWGAADMALMLIESNHDLRATRILVGRLNGKVQHLIETNGTAPPARPHSAGAANTPPGAMPPPTLPPPNSEL